MHRGLGVQVSKIRSLTMDTLDRDQRAILLALGNRTVNAAYLKYLPKNPHDVVPPMAKPDSNRAVREAWIKAKYVERRFARPSKERTISSAEARHHGTGRHHAAKHLLETGSLNADQRAVSVSQLITMEEEERRKMSTSGRGDDEDEEESSPKSPKGSWLSTPTLSPRGTATAVAGSSAGRLAAKLVTKAGGSRRRSAVGSDPRLSGSTDDILSSPADPAAPATMLDLIPESELVAAIETGDLPTIAGLAAVIGSGELANRRLAEKNTTPLHLALEKGHALLAEYLMLNGAKMNVLDGHLNTPLHVAAEHGRTRQVIQLLKRSADKNVSNQLGKNPLDLALGNAHADIVTILRMQQMRDELGEDFKTQWTK